MFNPVSIQPYVSASNFASAAILLSASLMFTTPSLPPTFQANIKPSVVASPSITIRATLSQAPPTVINPTSYEEGHFAKIESGTYSNKVSVPLRDLPEA